MKIRKSFVFALSRIFMGIFIGNAVLLAEDSPDAPSHFINPRLSEEKILEKLKELIPLGTPEKEVRTFIKDHDQLRISVDGVTKGERDRGLNGFTVFVGSYKAFPFIPVSNNVYAEIFFDEKGLLIEYVVVKEADGL